MIKSNAVNGSVEPMGWKTYNIIKKKAMEQEFSWSGLLISLSIAFFVVIAASEGLRFAYDTMSAKSAQAESVRMSQ